MDKVIVIRHSDDELSEYQKYLNAHGKHFSVKLLNYAMDQIKNGNGVAHLWSINDVLKILTELHLDVPSSSTIEDMTYTANMAYADFFPDILTEILCIKYAEAVANDIDGYEGILFCRWVSDLEGKENIINWNEFI